jgi:hypothetical protein
MGMLSGNLGQKDKGTMLRVKQYWSGRLSSQEDVAAEKRNSEEYYLKEKDK